MGRVKYAIKALGELWGRLCELQERQLQERLEIRVLDL